MKKLLASLAIIAGLTAPTIASEYFYEGGAGQWSVEGYTSDIGVTLCNASTHWDDGSYIGVVAERDLDYVYMEVYNAEWSIGDPIGTNSKLYVATFRFIDRYGRSTEGTIDYELVNDQTIRFHYLTEKFFTDWSKYREMYIIMPGDIQTINLGLNGTTAALYDLDTCIGKM